jgi:phosphatidate cytidylyltransferase
VSDLATRGLTALVGAPLLAWIAWTGGPFLTLFCTLLAVLAFREMRFLLKSKGTSHSFAYVLPYVLLLPLLAGFSKSDFLTVLGGLTLVWSMLLLLRELFSSRSEVLASIGADLVAGLVAAFPFASALAFSRLLEAQNAHAGAWLLLVLLCVFAVDTFAYFGGRAFGRHKLFERVSPKKTIEGFLVGLVSCVLTAWLLARFAFDLPQITALVVGLVVGLLGPAGDLVESRLKRDAGVKDSSNLLPGHGGILDRFDSWILTMPILYILVRSGLLLF